MSADRCSAPGNEVVYEKSEKSEKSRIRQSVGYGKRTDLAGN
jgi:hypothetical protein